MNAKPCRLAATLVLLCMAVPGFAQMSTDNPSSTPTGKGTAADGSRPADGAITGAAELLSDNPTLARSIRNRFAYLDPLNHIQVELLRRYRGGDQDERTVRAIHLTINGIAAALRNSG